MLTECGTGPSGEEITKQIATSAQWGVCGNSPDFTDELET